MAAMKTWLGFLALFSVGIVMAAEMKPAMHEARGDGKAFLPDGRAVIRFDASAPKDASATWALESRLAPGWHTVELGFGPEQNTRKLIDFECLDETGAPVLSVNLYHAPSRNGTQPLATFGMHLARPAVAIRWRKNQVRNMVSAPLLQLRNQARPAPRKDAPSWKWWMLPWNRAKSDSFRPRRRTDACGFQLHRSR